ncbi:Hormone-sensitive lipase, partial [Plecturocebus cupreus]
MDLRTMTQSLVTLAEDNIAFFSSQGPGETARRLSGVFAGVREQALGLEPALGRLLGVAHLFDLDPETPANGYRSLVHTARCCLAHLLHKSHYVASNRRSIFFRTSHNLAELEAYLAALTQLRALVYYAQRLLVTNQPGGLFFEGDEGLTADFLREYVTLHKGCFYGRCLGFQFTPAIRPFLQTISIGLVSFGEHYKRNETGLSVAASSLFTSGRFAIDPELRGAEFERITQNLDVHFWKAFWNITEIEVLSSLANMASATVRVSRLLSLPPEAFEMPLTADPTLTVTISPPLAHTGPGPVLIRLISYDLREGQDSEELSSLVKANGQRSLELWPRPQQAPRSRSLVVHFHGGGFVAQTSKSHEPYLKSWAQELGAPIISIDYSLAPEAPFPRALEECFFAYCWAIKHCALLGSTGERICLAGDSAGGNLCFTVALRAAAYGVRVPDGIMAAYPATMLQPAASPSRLLSLMDPLLPLSVLSKCVSAYTGEAHILSRKGDYLDVCVLQGQAGIWDACDQGRRRQAEESTTACPFIFLGPWGHRCLKFCTLRLGPAERQGRLLFLEGLGCQRAGPQEEGRNVEEGGPLAWPGADEFSPRLLRLLFSACRAGQPPPWGVSEDPLDRPRNHDDCSGLVAPKAALPAPSSKEGSRSWGSKTEDHSNSDQKALGMMGLVRRDTAMLLRDFRLGASSWLNSFLELSGRKSQKMSEPTA